MQRAIKTFKETVIPSVLNSYSVVFFFNNKLIAFILLIVTFFNFFAGLSGLIAVLTAVLIANHMGFNKILLRQGIYSFNALLTGIGLGTLFEPGLVFLAVLLLVSILSLILSVVLSGWLGKYGLPFLSLPFVISLWLVLLPLDHIANLGLTQRNVFWMNEMYAFGGKQLLDFFQTVDNLPFSNLLAGYLRSMSSILFQDNLLAGILIALGLLATSRIAFLLSVTGFLSAWVFASFIGYDMVSFSFYNVGANYILVAIAIGGFFNIPSRFSFLWAVLLVPLTSLVLLFMRKFLGTFSLPVFSLPFSLVTIMFLYFLILRVKPGKLVLTPVQHFSPETNLYTYVNNVDRLTRSNFFPFSLPFWGEWTVSQGHDGKYTHKGDWSKANDFVLVDEFGKTYGSAPNQCDNYYCYNKPVLAPADGTVIDITDQIDDNEPGKVNTSQNWGNTIIIKHLNDLFTQMSHLKAGSFKVKTGDFVKKGDVIAVCGNSGRSPEPHLHFQAQLTSTHGAKTLDYPFGYYFLKSNDKFLLKSFSVPSEGDTVTNILSNPLLRSAFSFEPGMIMNFKFTRNKTEDLSATWEIFTDAWNNKYFFCKSTQSIAYFINDGTMFYFTAFYGDRDSLLYYFYMTSFKILLGYYPDIEINDRYPLQMIRKNKISLWMHDLIAPFHQYMEARYQNKIRWSDKSANPSELHLSARIDLSSFNKAETVASGHIVLAENKIKEFSLETSKTKIWALSTD